MMPTTYFRDGQWKKKSHAIISLIFFSVLVVLSLVGHRDVEYISRDHLSAFCKKYGLTFAVICQNDAYKSLQRWAMEEKFPCDHFFDFFSVLVVLSLVRHRDVEYISR